MLIRSLGVSLQIKALNYCWTPDGYWMLGHVYLRFYTLKTGLGPIQRLFVYIESSCLLLCMCEILLVAACVRR